MHECAQTAPYILPLKVTDLNFCNKYGQYLKI